MRFYLSIILATILLVTLKLLGPLAHWSWWLVTCPAWVVCGLWAIVAIAIVVIALWLMALDWIKTRGRRQESNLPTKLS
jgi:hypothetical protein